MLSLYFKPKRTTVASRGFLATAQLSRYCVLNGDVVAVAYSHWWADGSHMCPAVLPNDMFFFYVVLLLLSTILLMGKLNAYNICMYVRV